MRVSKKGLATSFAIAVVASALAVVGVTLAGGSAGATSADVIQYVQQNGANGTYFKYIPGDGSASTTQAITSGGGGCSVPTPSGVPLLNFSALSYASTSYGLPATTASVGAYKQRTGVCAVPQAWSIEPGEGLFFSVGTNSLVNGRLLVSADIDLQNQDKSGSATGRVQLIEYRAGAQVATQNVTIPAAQYSNFVGSTGTIAAGFDSIEVRVPSPPSAATASVSVVGPQSTFTFGSPALSVTKTDNLGGAKYDHVGQTIGYTLTAKNVGNLTLHSVNVTDNPTLDGFSCSPAVPATLAPNASVTCTGSHTVTQADLNAGSFTDTASATSTETPTAVTATDTVNAQQSQSLTLTKADNLAGTNYDHVGQIIGYTLTAANAGNVTLNNVNVTDNPALSSFSCNPAVPAASLAPNAQIVCTGSHTVTQADLDTGSFSDTGSATSNQTSPATTATNTVNANQIKSLTVSKTDSLNGSTYSQPGQVVTYTLTATNGGNVTLHNVTLSDNPALDGFSCAPATLAPGASLTCTGSHTITLDDLQAGTFSDTASATSTETPTATTASDTITAATQQICGGQTITTSSSAAAGAVQGSFTLNGDPTFCKSYTYLAASAGTPGTTNPSTITWLSQQITGAHVSATFVWGYETYCTPDGSNNAPTCPITTFDLGDGTGFHPQTYCAAADPNPADGRLWCTTDRTYKYLTDPSTGTVVTQITETWDGYGDYVSRH